MISLLTRPGLYAGIAALMLMAGCSSAPPIRYYTLGPLPAGAVAAPVASPSMVVGPVTLPEAIDRLQMVRSTEGVRSEVSDLHRWSGPLKNEIARRVASELTRTRGLARVVAWPQASIAAPDLSLPIDVQRFEATGFQSVTLEAVWALRQNGKDVAAQRFAATEAVSPPSYAGLAAAHGRLIDALARDIASAIPVKP